jgi:C-terminal processing protease CtpA/Prc
MIQVELERRISVTNPVSSSVIPAKNGHKVGYMKMTEFNAACKRGVFEAVKQLQSEGVDDFVLDLRGNLGGVLDGALQVTRRHVTYRYVTSRSHCYVPLLFIDFFAFYLCVTYAYVFVCFLFFFSLGSPAR